MVAYQMHERANGSGYPRGRTIEQTHPLARIAAVADSFTALVSARPHRAGMLPYFAVEKLVRDTAKGLFDPQAVRGLLQAVSLFPIGSYVELNDGYVGRVIRSNAFDYTKPIVEAWKRGRTSLRPGGRALGADRPLRKLPKTRAVTSLNEARRRQPVLLNNPTSGESR